METKKNYMKMKLLMAAFILFCLPVFADNVSTKASASVISEDDKLMEILSYIAMGVGTIAVIWIAWFLSNRGSDSSSPKTRMKIR